MSAPTNCTDTLLSTSPPLPLTYDLLASYIAEVPVNVPSSSNMGETLPSYLYIPTIYVYTSAPSILLSIMTIILDIFVIKFYWRSELTVVPLLYTFIAFLDILTAAGVIHFFVVFIAYTKEWISLKTLDVNGLVFLSSSRCSVFCNLVLAVSRTIMILKPFYQINGKAVKLACLIYAVPLIILYGLNIAKFYSSYVLQISLRAFFIGAGLGRVINDIVQKKRYDIVLTLATLLDVFAFIIPVMIVIITCIIQVISLHRSSQFPTSSNQRHVIVTITILLMSTLFVICNSPNAGYVASLIMSYVSVKFSLSSISLEGFYITTSLSAIVLPIVNSALNPVIIISRRSGMRRKFLKSFQRTSVGSSW